VNKLLDARRSYSQFTRQSLLARFVNAGTLIDLDDNVRQPGQIFEPLRSGMAAYFNQLATNAYTPMAYHLCAATDRERHLRSTVRFRASLSASLSR